MNKVVLLDRDGTINVEPDDGRVTDESEIIFFDDTMTALKKLADAGFSAIFITNQIEIAEGNLPEDKFHKINNKIIDDISSSGIKILKTYYCPHLANGGCECRKPKPGMLVSAIKEFDLEPVKTFMVGDRLTDVIAGRSAGVKTIHICSGQNGSNYADYEAENLTEAVDYVIANS